MFKTEFTQGSMLVLGGAKSGKSRFALSFCNEMQRESIFIATAQAWDDEMRDRISRHKAERGKNWLTVEEPLQIAREIKKRSHKNAVILLDCLTLWLNNLFMTYGSEESSIDHALDGLIDQLSLMEGAIVLVSNEVGMGIVPENELPRRYRDMAGLFNQRIARIAKKVVMVVSGLPLILKDT